MLVLFSERGISLETHPQQDRLVDRMAWFIAVAAATVAAGARTETPGFSTTLAASEKLSATLLPQLL